MAVTVMAGNPARKWWALIAIAASVLVVGLDLTVLNLALPTIATDLHASTGDLQWIADAYSLVLAAAMLPAGLLGDRLGRKKVLLVALVLFGASSAACAYATSVGELIAARAVLGIGAAAIFPLSLAIIPVLFAREEWLRLDVVGVLLSSAGLVGLTYGFIQAGQDGWTDTAALAAIVAGAAVLGVFVAWESWLTRRAGSVRPLIELRLFRSAGFTWGTTLATLVS